MFSTESSFIDSKVIVTTVLFLSLSLVPARADDLTMMIEEYLASLGYDTGTVDGEADVKTTVAISQFQHEKGLEVTGVVSPQLAGILAAEVDKGSSSAAAGTASSSVAQQSSSTSQMNAAQQQACLQEKIAAAQQAQPKKKKGFGGAFSSLAKTVSKYGGDDVAKASAEIMEAGATANDLAETARELGISESNIADCQPPAVQVAGGVAVTGSASPATTASQPNGQNVRYANQGTFQAGSYTLGQFDAMLEACTGSRPGFRAEVDALVTEAHPGYRSEALSLYDSQYQSMSQTLGSASSGTCPDAQVAKLRGQADATLQSLRPKAMPSPPVAQTAAVSTGAASAGGAKPNANASTNQSIAAEADSASLLTKLEHCEIMGLAIKNTGGFYGLPPKAPPGKFKSNLGLKTCSSKCRSAFEYTLARSRPANPQTINTHVSECHDNYRQAIVEYDKILADFKGAFANYAVLRQQVQNEYSARGFTSDKNYGGHERSCEQNGGQDCDVYAMCITVYRGAAEAPPCGIFFYGSGNTGNESAWEKARDGLIASGEAINFANMSAVLPDEMSRAVVAESAAFEADCDRQESYNQNKLRNCSCYRNIYLDERVKTQRLTLVGQHAFDQNLLRDSGWTQCINEEGFRDYVMRGCMNQGKGRGPEIEAAYKAYCQCQVEPTLDEVKIQAEYGGGWRIGDASIKAMQACRELRP